MCIPVVCLKGEGDWESDPDGNKLPVCRLSREVPEEESSDRHRAFALFGAAREKSIFVHTVSRILEDAAPASSKSLDVMHWMLDVLRGVAKGSVREDCRIRVSKVRLSPSKKSVRVPSSLYYGPLIPRSSSDRPALTPANADRGSRVCISGEVYK